MSSAAAIPDGPRGNPIKPDSPLFRNNSSGNGSTPGMRMLVAGCLSDGWPGRRTNTHGPVGPAVPTGAGSENRESRRARSALHAFIEEIVRQEQGPVVA